MAKTKCTNCGAWYDSKDPHKCSTLGGRGDLAKFEENSETYGTDGDL